MAQTFQAKFVQDGDAIDYTPSSATAAGTIVIQDALVGITHLPIAANQLGSIQIPKSPVYDIVKTNGAITAGAKVYWAAAGNPQGGTAGTGAASTTNTGVFLGYAQKAAGITDETVRVVRVHTGA